MTNKFFCHLALFYLFLIFSAVPAVAVDDTAVFVDLIPIPESMVEKRMRSGEMSGASQIGAETEKFRQNVLQTLITEQVCLNEADSLREELEDEINSEADRRYEKMIGAIESYIRTSYPNLEQSELDEQIDSLLKMQGESRESYRETALRYAKISALEDYWLQFCPQPSEDEISAYYHELYSSQKKLFDADENAFESAMLKDELVVYRPEDLKLIRKAEFLFDDEVIHFLRQARQLGVSSLDSQIEAQYHALADSVEPVYESLMTGELSFSELLEQLEPGSSEKVNYFNPKSTRFSKDYYERANAFGRIGEISTAYVIPNGYAVLEYYGNIPAGDVPIEEAAEAIENAIVQNRSKDFLKMKKQELLDHAEIIFPVNGQ